MPPSFLKFFDVAGLVGAGIKCPLCNSRRCRQSKWHSRHEKSVSAALLPYRCEDCDYRFLATSGAARERVLINGAAAVLLGLGGLTGVDLWFEGADKAKVERARLASVARSEDSTTGLPRRLPTGGELADARLDPAARSNKQQEAAENGDAGAMLQLGRDLASGNNRPKDVEQAAKWVQLAAATGNPDAMLELGRFYRDGLGLPPDSARAYAWFSRAAARNPAALLEREAMVRTMSKEQLLEADQLSLPTAPAAAIVRPK